jgi:hypothetical protein
MKKCYIFLSLFMAFTSLLSAQAFDSTRVWFVKENGIPLLYHVSNDVPLIGGANLGTFNRAIGQTLKIGQRRAIFNKGTSPCQVGSVTFSYELYKDNDMTPPVASQSNISLPLDLNIPPLSVWNIDPFTNNINLVTSTTPVGNYILKVKYDYTIQFGPGPCTYC